MANMLDEMNGPVMEEGRGINVIAKQLPVEKDFSATMSVLGSYLLGVILIVFGIIIGNLYLIIVGIIIPIAVFVIVKKQETYFSQLEQRIQQSASQIDNYMEQRVQVLQNTVALVDRAIDLDKSVFAEIARLRSGLGKEDTTRNELQDNLDKAYRGLNIAVESYPDLKADRKSVV